MCQNTNKWSAVRGSVLSYHLGWIKWRESFGEQRNVFSSTLIRGDTENDEDVIWLLDWLLKDEWENKSKQNPLFANPVKWRVKVIKKEDMPKIDSKNKIRV